MDKQEARIFWLDGFRGKAKGGHYLRNPMVEFFKTLDEKKMRPVGIIYNGTWNLEILVEEHES